MNEQQIRQWAEAHPFEPIHVDCTTTVMLKILDGKCKMSSAEKSVMELLYDAVKHHPGELFSDEFHTLIATARQQLTEGLKNHIYEKRVLAETMLSRPVMKSFKAMIREKGVFAAAEISEEGEDDSVHAPHD